MANGNMFNTQKVGGFDHPAGTPARDLLLHVYDALCEKGYNPINQIVGYILSGDPTYITSHKNARAMIGTLERDELLEEMLRGYLRGGADA